MKKRTLTLVSLAILTLIGFSHARPVRARPRLDFAWYNILDYFDEESDIDNPLYHWNVDPPPDCGGEVWDYDIDYLPIDWKDITPSWYAPLWWREDHYAADNYLYGGSIAITLNGEHEINTAAWALADTTPNWTPWPGGYNESNIVICDEYYNQVYSAHWESGPFSYDALHGLIDGSITGKYIFFQAPLIFAVDPGNDWGHPIGVGPLELNIQIWTESYPYSTLPPPEQRWVKPVLSTDNTGVVPIEYGVHSIYTDDNDDPVFNVFSGMVTYINEEATYDTVYVQKTSGHQVYYEVYNLVSTVNVGDYIPEGCILGETGGILLFGHADPDNGELPWFTYAEPDPLADDCDTVFYPPVNDFEAAHTTLPVEYPNNIDGGPVYEFPVSNIVGEKQAPVYATIDGEVTGVLPTNPYGSRQGYVVSIGNDDGYHSTYYGIDPLFVGNGEPVTKGCLLGYATDSDDYYGTPVLSELEYDDHDNDYQPIDWAFIRNAMEADGTLTENATHCGYNPLTKGDCINDNPNLSNRSERWYWELFTHALEFFDDSVIIPAQSMLYQDIVLSPSQVSTGVYITIAARPEHRGDTVHIDSSIGDGDGETLEFDNPEFQIRQTTEIKGIHIVPTIGDDIYRLRVQTAINSEPAEVDFVCLHGQHANIIGTPNCYFDNWDFSTDQDWSFVNGAIQTSSRTSTRMEPVGYVIFPNTGALIRHPVTLESWEDANAEYRVTLIANIAPPPTSGNLIPGVSSGVLEVYVLDDQQNETAIGSVDFDDFVTWGEQEIEFTVADGDTLEGQFVIEAIALNSIGYIQLNTVCIQPIGSSTWPGEPEPVYTPPSGPGSTLGCPRPASLSLIEWVGWIICIIEPYLADIIALVGDVLAIIDSMIDLLSLIVLWLSETTRVIFSWLFALIYNILTTVIGLIAYALATFWNALINQDWLAAFLGVLELAGTVIDLIIALIGLVIVLVVAGVFLIASLGRIAARLWGGVTLAINAGDATALNVPTCSGPPYSSDLCWGLAVADHAIAEPPLSYLPYIVAGAIGLFAIFWTLGKIGDAVEEI